MPACPDEVGELGILKMESSHRIVKFVEKPTTPKELRNLRFKKPKDPKYPYLASMGVYVFKAGALRKALEGNDTDFGREVIPHSIKKFKGFGYIFGGYWKDIGTIRSFYETNLELAESKPHLAFLYKGRVFTRPRFLSPSRISNCRIEQALITEGCIINDAEIKNSTIGLRAIIGKGCKITNTVLMGADYYEESPSRGTVKIGIGDNSIIENAIIDKNARIGKNVIIKNLSSVKDADSGYYFIKDGIVVIPKNATIKDGTKI